MKRKVLLVAALFMFFEICLTHPSIDANETSLTLIYTSNTLGGVEPCGTCPESGNTGGLARRAHHIKTVKEEAKNLLMLDAGDALVVSYFSETKRREQARRRAELVLKLYETIGYHALNIGDTDLGLGIQYLKNLQRKSTIPFLSANLKERKTGRHVFKPHLIKEVEGRTIGILGLITAEISPNIQKELKNYSIENPIKTATETINHFMASCDHIIALAHLTPPEVESLAKEVPRISIIIGGNDRSFVFPRQIGRSLYVQADSFGAHVGRLNLNLFMGSFEFSDILSRRLIQKKIGEIQEKIEDPKHAKDLQGLKELRDILIEQKKKIPNSEGKNTYENYLILMHPGMKSDPEIQNMIDSSRGQLKRPLP
jgi:2',3'-cyclic-nucleotide 2'-phosphodiesterase (5'-nucleotidase family)